MARESFLDLDDFSLVTQLRETKEELFKLRFQHATGQLSNYTRLGDTRKNVARLQTELRAREIAAAEEEAGSEEKA